MAHGTIHRSCDRALAAATTFQASMMGLLRRQRALSMADVKRLDPTTTEISRLQQSDAARGTVLYLAYGSNLSVEKFRKDRGIQPLAQINVQVPDLRLTFDLPGIPYTEPCFANSGRRDPRNDSDKHTGYRKDNWHKGLIGVVYEVTPEDYAHIIATEGGGSGYQDILVDSFPFADADPSVAVPKAPTTQSFKAHTLFAPTLPDGEPPKQGGRTGRKDPSYAQPSARYLKLITDGAQELELPYEYQDYLHSIRPYRITTARQRAGQALLLSTWLPVVMMIFGLNRIFADKNGILPGWLRRLTVMVFAAVWTSYDNFFKPNFGDGERSIPDQKNATSREASYGFEKSVALTEQLPLLTEVDIEDVALQASDV